MTYYLSGPMSGYPDHNFPAFERACVWLRARGVVVVSPHEVPHPEPNGPGSLPWDVYLRRDVIQLMRCDGIVLLKGWPESKGAQLEAFAAISLGLEIRYFHEETNWADGDRLIRMGRE